MKNNVGQHFIGGFDGTRITKTIIRLIEKDHIGGFILFTRNIESPRQVRSLIKRLQSRSRRPLFISVDQEGGRVFRLKAPFTKVPPMATIGRYVRKTKDLRLVSRLGRLMGRELKAVGFNLNFAPIVDIHSNPKNPIIGDRSFGPDPKLVAQCAKAMIRGLHNEGVISCSKHFPGHGATSSDSHRTLPVLKASGRLLWRRDIWPYRRLKDQGCLPCLMTAHVLYPRLDAEHCATHSRNIMTDLLRKRIGYRGVVVSDDLLMKAVSKPYSVAESSLRFFAAGGDLALICREPELQREAIDHVAQKARKDKKLRNHFSRSSARIQSLKKRFCRRTPNLITTQSGTLTPQSVLGPLAAYQ